MTEAITHPPLEIERSEAGWRECDELLKLIITVPAAGATGYAVAKSLEAYNPHSSSVSR
jgi:hypothetical protein